MAEIHFQNVCKQFRDTAVVKDLNLTIQDKEFFTFVGPSGCGKSTILNLVAGLEALSGGTISFDGSAVDPLPPGDRDVAMVFQSYALYPHMTVYENMAFPLKVKKESPETIRFEMERVAALLGLQSLLNRRPKELSGGQRQRVALGRALIRKPKVFLMDEPLSNLDASLRLEMRGELARLHKEFPITTVYVTHDQEEAMVLSDRIAVLYDGRVQQCGPPMEVYEEPANLFVAGFIGSPSMRFLDATLLQGASLFSDLLSRVDNKDLVVGIRPADLVVSGQEDKEALKAEVALLEPTGSDTWVDGLWNDRVLKGKAVPDSKLTVGDQAFFTIPLGQVHFFDKKTGDRRPLEMEFFRNSGGRLQ